MFWVDASCKKSLERGFSQIADACKISPDVDKVKQYLSNASESWVLFLDNADDPLLDISEYFPAGNRGIILITTRNQSCKINATVGSRELGAMPTDEAITLILKTSGIGNLTDTLIRETARPVVSTLGCLALAIIQAGAAIREGCCKMTDYCQVYSRHRQELLSRRAVQGGEGYQYTVYTTWEVSVKTIEERSSEAAQDAIELLKIFSFLHHDKIPKSMFILASTAPDETSSGWMLSHQPNLILRQKGQTWDAYPLDAALSLLLAFSLITVDEYDLVSIHPLVHTWARDRLSSSDQDAIWAKTISTLALSIPWFHMTKAYYYRRLLVAHIDACLGDDKHKLFRLHGAGEDCQEMASNFTLVYYEAGRRQDALQLMEREMELNQKDLGEEHPKTLTSMRNLGVQYKQMGRLKEASQLIEKMAKARVRTLGKEHYDTLDSLATLAGIYHVTGKPRKALWLLEQVVKARKKTLGEENFDTLNSASNLAMMYSKMGRIDEALQLSKGVVKAFKRTLGEDNPNILILLQNLANIYSDVGQVDRALELTKQVLQAYARSLGEDHPDAIDSALSLACGYCQAGQLERARPVMEKVVEASKRVLGEEAPNTLIAINNLANLYDRLGPIQDGLHLVSRSLKCTLIPGVMT